MNTPRNLARLCGAVLLLVPLATQAVTCLNSIPPTNPDSAYTDHGNATVTHTPTGLMWKRCSEGQTWDGATCTGAASTHTWQAALDLAEAASFAGHGDWRLPNINELRSLVEDCRVNPSINDTLFPATPSSSFWSGSPDTGQSSSAWEVDFDGGNIPAAFRSLSEHVRLVRSGQSFASFDARGDATPDALGDFAAVTNAPAGTVTASTDSKTVAGIDTATGVAIAGEGNPAYRINGGAWTSAPDSLDAGAVLEVRLTAGAAGSTRVATLTVGGVSANFSVTAVAAGGGGGGETAESALSFPSAPVSYACTGPDVSTFASTDAASARPLSSALIMNRDLWLTASLAPFAQPVDVYIVAELPGGELLVLNNLGQWLPYPAQATPWRANSSAALNATVWQSALTAIPPGAYTAYVAVVPPGTNPATFDLKSSPYHLWCSTRSVR